MEYALLITIDEAQAPTPPEPGTPEFEEYMAPWQAYNDMLVAGGHLLAAASLVPSAATTVVHNGAGTTGDGPYVETKEQVAGFYLVTAADLDEALELARRIPLPVPVEVRPVATRAMP